MVEGGLISVLTEELASEVVDPVRVTLTESYFINYNG